VLLALAVSTNPVSLYAQSIYKSVDSQGHVQFSDRPQGSGEEQNVVVEAASPPKIVHFCWTNCFTLVESHGTYSRVDATDETWTVQRFTPTSLVLTRHDPPAEWNGFKPEVRYAGRIDGERLVDVTVDGRPTGDIRMAWGSAVESLPGSNAERDRRQSQGLWPPADVQPDTQSMTAATEAPPPLPSEEQPVCAVEGSIWQPGYWTWRATRYSWVQGAWVRPLRVGLLWTPGYWVLAGGMFVFHPGFWGPVVGDYGGINYGHGYFGAGYTGGRWVGDQFHYNTAVSNVDLSVIRNVYREPAPAGLPIARARYVGGATRTTSLVARPGHAAGTKLLAASQPPHERTQQAAANASPTPTPHHNRKSHTTELTHPARNSTASHSQTTSEAPASPEHTSSAVARASHSGH
jgi:hypothetical protein